MANIQFQVRRGTASEWATANPILADGELAYETDTSKLKVGDGLTSYNPLPYFGVSVGDFPVSLTALSDGDLLVFEAASSSWKNIKKTSLLDGGSF